MLLYTRRDGVIVDASAGAAKLLNLAARSLEGRQLHLFVDRERLRIDAAIDPVLNGSPVAELEI